MCSVVADVSQAPDRAAGWRFRVDFQVALGNRSNQYHGSTPGVQLYNSDASLVSRSRVSLLLHASSAQL